MKQNDAFNLSWKIRKVNENTQSSFRLFSEGSFREKSCSLPSVVLCWKLGETRGPSGGRPCTEARVLREVEVTRQLAKRTFVYLLVASDTTWCTGEGESLCSHPCSHLTKASLTIRCLPLVIFKLGLLTQRLASNCGGNVKSTMS